MCKNDGCKQGIVCKFESSQKDESRWQSTDSSKAYRKTSAFKCKNESKTESHPDPRSVEIENRLNISFGIGSESLQNIFFGIILEFHAYVVELKNIIKILLKKWKSFVIE